MVSTCPPHAAWEWCWGSGCTASPGFPEQMRHPPCSQTLHFGTQHLETTHLSPSRSVCHLRVGNSTVHDSQLPGLAVTAMLPPGTAPRWPSTAGRGHGSGWEAFALQGVEIRFGDTEGFLLNRSFSRLQWPNSGYRHSCEKHRQKSGWTSFVERGSTGDFTAFADLCVCVCVCAGVQMCVHPMGQLVLGQQQQR